MIRFRIGAVEYSFSFWFFAVLSLFLLWHGRILAWYLLLPIAVHELGHLAVLMACRVRVREVRFTAFGIGLRRDSASMPGYGKEIAICLGGAAANGLLALGLHLFCFPSMRTMLLAASNLAVALFNLAPIGSLDGGQALALLGTRLFPPDVARTVSRAASFLMLGLLFGLAFFLLLIRRYNLTLLIVCVYLAVNVITQD